MANDTLRYCVTDKEIYDLLMSARQRISENTLHEIARSRGIFLSLRESRTELAAQIALLPHDYESLVEVLGHSENPNRTEKVTSITLNADISTEDIREVCNVLTENSEGDEKIIARPEGTNAYRLQVKYSEVDYSKTTLLQRRLREADLKFIVEAGKTTIRMPANPKAREVAEQIKQALDVRKKTAIPTEVIEISDLPPDDRTLFFTSLISKMEGYSLRNVSSIKVQSSLRSQSTSDEDGEEEDDDDTVEAKDEMLSVVENVAMKGQSLLGTPEYQQFRQKGFYLTSITWLSQQETAPFHRFEFEAGFEEQEEGKSFRYNVRGVYRRQDDGEYTKTLRPLKEDHKQEIFPVIERTANDVLASLRNNSHDGKPGAHKIASLGVPTTENKQ
jgi:hypothetical protein